MTPNSDIDLDHLSNGLLSKGTKPLPEPMFHIEKLSGNHLRAISRPLMKQQLLTEFGNYAF